MKRNRGDEPIQVIVHVYMETSQGNSLCSYLKQGKMSFFSFPSTKSENRRVEEVPRGWVGGLDRGRERMWDDEYSANTVYTCM
jgi:hypothetical protein